MALYVLALAVDVRIPEAHSLKDKRSTVRTIVEGARRRFEVGSAETGHLDRPQRAEMGFVAVAGSASHVVEVVDRVERFVWSFPEIEVVAADRHWMEVER